MELTFDYSVYYRQNCIVPIWFLLVFGIPFLVIGIIHSIKTIKAIIRKQYSFSLKNCVGTLFMLCIWGFMFVTNASQLLRGGIFLLFEKESDTILLSGVIEETGEMRHYFGGDYDVEQNHGYGETITINGTKYYLQTYGDCKIGDVVTIEVLPKSKFVLSIKNKK